MLMFSLCVWAQQIPGLLILASVFSASLFCLHATHSCATGIVQKAYLYVLRRILWHFITWIKQINVQVQTITVFLKKYILCGHFAHRWERKEKKRPRVVKSQWSILDIADIVLVSPRPASENNLFLVQIFNHIASHLSFNPQHTQGGLGAPHNRSKFKMISKCLAANLIHINLRQSMCQNPNIYKMQICTSGESSLQQVIIELNIVL